MKCSIKPWKILSNVGEHIHADYCSYKGKNFLIIIDEYSKCPEIYHVPNITSIVGMQCFKDYKARWVFLNSL